MKNQHPIFKRKQLVIAVSMAMLGGALTGCSSGSSSPAPGTATIVSSGGSAGNIAPASGGYGGLIDLYNRAGTGGVEVRTTGAANTDFTTPAQITSDATAVDLGDNPLEVIANLILQVVDTENQVIDGGGTTADEPYVGDDDVMRIAAGATAVYATDPTVAAGTAYLRPVMSSIARVYLSAGSTTANDTVVTGLSVAEGATLILGNNFMCGADVNFSNDIDNSGTITKEVDSEGCPLKLGANKYIASGNIVNAGTEEFEDGGPVFITAGTGINNSGPINVSGFDETNDVDHNDVLLDERGGDGGSITLLAGGYVLNSGMLDTSGGDGKTGGGDGGLYTFDGFNFNLVGVNMYAAYTENTGDIDSSGGNNVSDPLALLPGDGGEGGDVRFEADYVANNTANIATHGGDGSSGGDGGLISMDNSEFGEVKNAGSLTLNGGTGLAGNGGDGGDLDMRAYGGNLLNSGDLSSVGGNSTDTNGDGGDGGSLEFDGSPGDADKPAGDIVVSGNINTSGGSAVADGDGDGGDAGELDMDVFQAFADTAFNQRIALLGYVSIDANGGDGASAGSARNHDFNSMFNLRNSVNFQADGAENYLNQWFAGSVANDVPINARGGNGTTADPAAPLENHGGDGGEVGIFAATFDSVKALNVTATNTAAIDVSGGNAVGDASIVSSGGHGGGFELAAYHAATNSGAVNGSGGNGGQVGGDAERPIFFCCDSLPDDVTNIGIYSVVGQANNSGAIDYSGGDGAVSGGHGGEVELFGASSVNSADMNVNGGNATETDELVDSFGGDGGYVGILGLGLDAPATNNGAVTYSFGAGDTNGEDGCLQVGLTFEGNCSFDPEGFLLPPT